MQKIHVDLGSESYDIFVRGGIIKELSNLVRPLIAPSRVMIISNTTVSALYENSVRQALMPLQCDILSEAIPDGEEHKNMVTVERLLDKMIQARLDRQSMVVSVGGGVVGDIAGFTAAVYMRGLPYVQVPTTLLAQVDSSIGGKVGVDHRLGKNLIGAFYQPLLVCTDPDALRTLPEEHFCNGLAEVIKYGVIADEKLFALLEKQAAGVQKTEDGVLTDIIKRCCQIKARIVQQDVRETTGLRSILNYGHTVGHAIEAVTEYTRYTHGQAIAIGMAAAAKVAGLLKLPPQTLEERQERLLTSVGLPVRLQGVKFERLVEAMLLDKKARGGKLKFVVPVAIGRGTLKENVPPELIERALREVGAE
jgi:3-dehydroquinate synthase